MDRTGKARQIVRIPQMLISGQTALEPAQTTTLMGTLKVPKRGNAWLRTGSCKVKEVPQHQVWELPRQQVWELPPHQLWELPWHQLWQQGNTEWQRQASARCTATFQSAPPPRTPRRPRFRFRQPGQSSCSSTNKGPYKYRMRIKRGLLCSLQNQACRKLGCRLIWVAGRIPQGQVKGVSNP